MKYKFVAVSEYAALTYPDPVMFGVGSDGKAVGVGNVVIDTHA